MDKQLKPWYAVATPHEDIRKGRLDEAVFAANIWAVVQGTAPEVYLDPEEFYRKTYMTVGLETVLKRAADALAGRQDAGDRIISLQTAFGGGKTHLLIALWHLARHSNRLKDSPAAEDLRRVLGDSWPGDAQNVAVFTNHTCDATQGRDAGEGVHTRTLWGELAFQLGGKSLYEKVRANDDSQRVPQGIFAGVLREATPCVILLDELADYCVGAASVSVGDTTLADQTISFIQQLTEAVQQVPGAVVIATLPASKFEVAQSEKGQEAFVTLEKRFQRLGADVKPVADDEIYEVVRTRLFESIALDDPDYVKRLAYVYQGMYASHSGEVPNEASRTTYREQIQRAYPFHPLLIDALYTRWGAHPDFQRTRGVLRLLASIIGDLWNRREGSTETQHLIQPCHIRWSIDPLQAALTRLWGAAYQSVAAADAIGGRSNAGTFDEERGGDYRRESIGQGIASAIMLGSFGGKAQQSGFSSKDVKLASSRDGLNWSYTDGALLELENRCFYLHSTGAGSLGKRYWFGTKPNLNALVVQYRQRVAGESFEEDILSDLREEAKKGVGAGATWRIVVGPGKDLPEQKSLTLLILPPALTWNGNGEGNEAIVRDVRQINDRCGTKERTYRNTLVFLAGTSRGVSKLRQAYRQRAALEGVRADYGDQLDTEQKGELKKRLDDARRTTVEAIGPAYTVALRVHGSEVEPCVLSDARPSFQEHLSFLWTTLVEDEEWILRRLGSVTLEKTGLVPKEGALRLREAVEAFLRFTDKPMIATKGAVTSGIEQACEDGLVGIGRGASPTALQARYCTQSVSLDPTEEGVWIIPAFEPVEVDGALGGSTTEQGQEARTGVTTGGEEAIGKVGTTEAAKGTVTHFSVRGTVPVESWGELFRCFVGPATRMNLKKLQLGIEFDMEVPEGAKLGADDPRLKAMKESARQLGLDFGVGEK